MKTILLTLLLSLPAFAHNEDKLGPHQGFIRMPGAYHTEIVPKEAGTYDIYLLDVSIKNPTTENSTILLVHQDKTGIKNNFECSKQSDRFSCTIKKSIDLSSGKFLITSQRKGIRGGIAEYPIPLTVKKQEKHSGHHM
jgi:hypothetical protein